MLQFPLFWHWWNTLTLLFIPFSHWPTCLFNVIVHAKFFNKTIILNSIHRSTIENVNTHIPPWRHSISQLNFATAKCLHDLVSITFNQSDDGCVDQNFSSRPVSAKRTHAIHLFSIQFVEFVIRFYLADPLKWSPFRDFCDKKHPKNANEICEIRAN